MTKNELSIRDFYRTHLVERFNIVHTHRRQTIAEHHAMVTLLVGIIADKLNVTDDRTRHLLLLWASVHDLPEVITGDIPTPVKGAFDKQKLIKIEDLSGGYYLKSKRKVMNSPSKDLIIAITKIADMMDATFFLNEYGYGDHARTVRDKLIDRLSDYGVMLDETMSDWEWSKTINWLIRFLNEKPIYIEDLLEY